MPRDSLGENTIWNRIPRIGKRQRGNHFTNRSLSAADTTIWRTAVDSAACRRRDHLTLAVRPRSMIPAFGQARAGILIEDDR